MLELKTLHEATLDCHFPVASADIRELRLAFTELMERCAEAVQARGLEQDDILLERYADVRLMRGTGAVERSVHLPFLLEPADLVKAVARAFEDSGFGQVAAADALILRLRMQAVLEISPDAGRIAGNPYGLGSL